jgi:hypothetical protein
MTSSSGEGVPMKEKLLPKANGLLLPSDHDTGPPSDANLLKSLGAGLGRVDQDGSDLECFKAVEISCSRLSMILC